ncbi:hypothetical protein MRX96_010684 [Rhipicephalus microplus]
MVGFLSRDDWSIGDEGEVDARVGHQVGVELCQVDIQGTIKPQRGSDGGDDLADEPVEIRVGGPFNAEVALADVKDCLIVDHESAV